MKVFNILDYGARFCDELQTGAIQKAIDDCFLAGTDGVIEVIRSTPITVKESNLDECIEAHPGGVAFEDIKKFNLKTDI